MALFKFTRAILEGRPIDVYGAGAMERDFTYVDDIVDGVVAALDAAPGKDPDWRAEAPGPGTSGVAPGTTAALATKVPGSALRLAMTPSKGASSTLAGPFSPPPGVITASFSPLVTTWPRSFSRKVTLPEVSA
jgi:nucleoside-diphosphate-sugar epimerase